MLIRIILALMGGVSISWSMNPKIEPVSTQKKLQQIQSQISTVTSHLDKTINQRSTLQKKLEGIDKKMGEDIPKLNLLQQEISNNQREISHSQQDLDKLQAQLLSQQHGFSQYLRVYYQINQAHPPFIGLFNPNALQILNQRTTYYQYLLQAQQKIMIEVGQTQQKIKATQLKQQQHLSSQQSLLQKLEAQQKQLATQKDQQTLYIHSLDHDIQSHRRVLKGYEQDKKNLTSLMQSLTEQSVIQTRRPFALMHRKLISPVQVNKHNIISKSHGLSFLAEEGSVVRAVYPGKVVFSDWLKGYGLLLIIDHGRGYMTLYAHNQSLFKKTGQIVDENEQVATVGHTGGLKQNSLYFEIRYRGKTVPALDWLIY